MRDMYLAEHSRFHVIEQMTVVRPAAECIGGDRIAHLLRRIHIDRVLAHLEGAVGRFELAPHSVKVNRVRHHAVVYERDTQTFTMIEA